MTSNMNFTHSLQKLRSFIGAVLVAYFFAIPLSAQSAGPTVGTADSNRYIEDVKSLTAPAMEGRGDGTKGLTLAAHMLEKRYSQLGLKPAGTHSYFQPFTLITGAKLKSAHNHFSIEEASGKHELKLNRDFVPFSFSSSGAVSGQVVFAGYGASADEFGYDDYAGIDVKDKIAVILRYEPAGLPKKPETTGSPATPS